MADNYWLRVEEIFHQALEQPASGRSSFIHESCAGDRELELEVTEILNGYEAQDRLASSTTPASVENQRFGAFEIVRKIGEGGMGAVYLARRHEDFEQRAAIKLLQGTPAAMALMAGRFREERQILAGLDHPNIARLLDGGVAPSGQPYLVMDYVEGVRLDQYCESQQLSLRQRLQLFRKLCAAVQFAHQRLVIHRDLKPGNILVNEQGEPKLLDFGIAKVLAAPGGSPQQTLTMGADVLLTPQYASPEQIKGQPCGVPSDIYSLGVILYELLARTGPYSSTASTPAELIAAVVTQDAPRPSALAPEPLRAPLRGDLDGIVMKALAKQPGDRYGSVEQLSEDVQRYLEGLPVTAVEGTRLYIARKFVRRHRVAVAAAALVLLSLIAGLAGTLWQARAANRERALAEQRFSDARKLADYLLFPLYDSVQALPGSLPVRADMASQSLLYLDRLASAKSNDRALRLDLAEGYLRLGTILEAPVGSGDSLGDTSKALEVDRKAVALLEPLDQESPHDTRIERDLGNAYQLLGGVWNLRGQPDDGIAELKKATAIFDRLPASDVDGLIAGARAYLALGDAVSGKGGGYVEMASRAPVLADADTAVARFQSALAARPDDARALVGLAQAYNLKGNMVGLSDVNAASPIYKLGVDALRRLPPTARQTADSQALEARLLTMIGFFEEEAGQYAEAIATVEPAREILDRLAAQDPRNATNALRRVNLYRTRGFANQNWGHTKDAIGDFRTCIQILDGMIAVDPVKQSARLIRAELQGRLSQMLAKDGRMADAEQVSRESLNYFAQMAERPDAASQNLNEAAAAFSGSPVPSLIDYPRALRYAQRADQLAQGKDVSAIFYIAQCYEEMGDGPKALEAIRRDLALLPPPAPGEKPSRNRLLAERHLRRIESLIKTGHLPPE